MKNEGSKMKKSMWQDQRIDDETPINNNTMDNKLKLSPEQVIQLFLISSMNRNKLFKQLKMEI